MKKMNLHWHYSLPVTALLLLLTISCDPEDPEVPIEPGTITDLDGNIYHTVTICDQVWMIENLNVTKFRNGDAIPKVMDEVAWSTLTTPAYCYYNNDSATYAATYGILYNWYAVNDPRGLAPEGWHIPTNIEWTAITNCLGGDVVAGGPMKENGYEHWNAPNTGASNISGFTGLPGGLRENDGAFYNIGSLASFWSDTEHIYNDSWYRILGLADTELVTSSKHKGSGLSVRCLKD